jgi:hypothetical protein
MDRTPTHTQACQTGVDHLTLPDKVARRDLPTLNSKAFDQINLDLLLGLEDPLGRLVVGAHRRAKDRQAKDRQTVLLANMATIGLDQADQADHHLVALCLASLIESQSPGKPTASRLTTLLTTTLLMGTAAVLFPVDMIDGPHLPLISKAWGAVVQTQTLTTIDLVLAS